jgi:hypothetical protein
VRPVIAAATARSSRLRVSGRQSTKTGTAPRSTYAFAVETNVNDGRITSSPGCRSSSSPVSSSACVQDVVSSADGAPTSAVSRSVARPVNGPSPEVCPDATDRIRYSHSRGARKGRLNGITPVQPP